MTRKLTYREIVREFLLFLKTEHVYKQYIEATKKQRKSEIKNWGNEINILTIPNLKECFRNNRNLACLIDKAFLWNSTKEGHDFWMTLDRKWMAKMLNVELVAEKINK